MRIKLTIPSIEDITIGQFQKIEKCYLENGECDFSDKFMIKTIFGLSSEAIDSVKQTKINEVVTELKAVLNSPVNLQTTFELNGISFGFIPNIEEITTGEYADLEKYAPNSEDYHKAMAVMYRPIRLQAKGKYKIKKYNGTDEFALLMKDAPFSVLKGALVFFWNLENDLLKSSLAFIKTQAEQMAIESEQLLSKGTQKNGDGLARLLELQGAIISELERSKGLVFMNR